MILKRPWKQYKTLYKPGIFELYWYPGNYPTVYQVASPGSEFKYYSGPDTTETYFDAEYIFWEYTCFEDTIKLWKTDTQQVLSCSVPVHYEYIFLDTKEAVGEYLKSISGAKEVSICC